MYKYQYKTILTENDNGIITIFLNRPEAMNALNSNVFEDLDFFFSEDFKSYAILKGIIITGSGDRAFAAGADITEFLGMTNNEGTDKSVTGMKILDKIEQFHVPVIAVVKGFSLGGGNELAMACHMIIAGEKARFGQPEMNLGLITGYGGTQRLTRNIGRLKSMELLLTGDVINAQEALGLGLVNHVVESGKEIDKAKEIISKISSKSLYATSRMIDAVNAYYDKSINGFDVEAKLFGETIGSHDGQEGSKAFLDKRKADFKGN